LLHLGECEVMICWWTVSRYILTKIALGFENILDLVFHNHPKYNQEFRLIKAEAY
jgi:hypothetical protein